MPAAIRLELVSSSGDETLPRLRYVMHAARNATESVVMTDNGLEFTEGEAIVITSVIHANSIAGEVDSSRPDRAPGAIFVGIVPPDLHVGYAAGTTAHIDRKLRTVSGSPLRYAGARNELSLYSSSDVDAARLKLESDEASGYSAGDHPRTVWSRENLIGYFAAGKLTDLACRHIAVALEDLQPLDFNRVGRLLEEAYRPAQPAHAVLAASAIHDIVVGTAEASLLSMVRNMRWQGLALLGYHFLEGKREINIELAGDMAFHRRRMDELGRKLASSELFRGELGWGMTYVEHGLRVMRMEIDEA